MSTRGTTAAGIPVVAGAGVGAGAFVRPGAREFVAADTGAVAGACTSTVGCIGGCGCGCAATGAETDTAIGAAAIAGVGAG